MDKADKSKKQKSSIEPSKDKDTEITSTYFAPEIFSNVFLWLPIASLHIASLVCKDWFGMISNPDFIRAYYLNQGFFLLLQEPSLRFYETYHVTMRGGYLSKIESTRLQFTKKFVSSCNEFALIKPKVEKPYLSVLNLATQKTLWLPHSPLSVSDEYLNYYGIGLNPTTKMYKVVCFGRTIGNNIIRCEVLNQGSTTWRPIDETLDGSIIPGYSISINGFLHWHGDVFTGYSTKIISMDLNNEKFLVTPVPNMYSPQRPCAFDLLEIGGCLSLIEYEVSCQIQLEIWKLKNISDGTWERIFSVSLATIRCYPVVSSDDLYYIGSLYNGKFLLSKHHKKWVSKLEYYVVDIEKQEIKRVPIDIRMLSAWNAHSINMSMCLPFSF
ncbi:uncharacterized protein LOC122072796 [Macadamia integrifolia]|uniref:uncharacterized protein LOC122072796 n=1 Tax=Macadamia integrifolia TaxID=60698 RepID=UPI001C4F6C61|nr:uncharacterized protein LOC122072796 [Macadamia integrifolia]